MGYVGHDVRRARWITLDSEGNQSDLLGPELSEIDGSKISDLREKDARIFLENGTELQYIDDKSYGDSINVRAILVNPYDYYCWGHLIIVPKSEHKIIEEERIEITNDEEHNEITNDEEIDFDSELSDNEEE
jgi:hypothetical protein